jgi:hypothetical protein
MEILVQSVKVLVLRVLENDLKREVTSVLGYEINVALFVSWLL